MMRIAAVIVLAASMSGGTPLTSGAAQPCEVRGALVGSVAQAGERRAGLIVETPAGTRQFCIAFTEAEERAGFDGIDLLQRAGLPVVLGGTRDTASVCRIGDDGCTDPGDCFCQCRVASDDACAFWGYYTLDGGRWAFAQTSASLRRVKDGDVDGWRFGNHAGGDGAPPAVPSQRCVNATTVAATGAPASAPRGGGFGAGWIAAAVVALAFAGGIAWGARGRRRGAE